MRIKRIEIIGFKSFCDRTVLNFSEPVIGVVGPNGCGKSNIVDAIRWCMGEQSAKHLRGQGMSDVIFAGSDSREPAGMAEVSLTFEDVGFSAETLQTALAAEPDIDPRMGEGEADAGANAEAEAEADAEADVEATAEAGGAQGSRSGPEAGDAVPHAGVRGTQSPDAISAQGSRSGPEAGDAVPHAGVRGTQSPDAISASGGTQAPDAISVFADPTPPIDYSAFSEVTITRRLFRDGTSQYLLNKTPCRLRDVTDFFLGTGVGTKAYSIIEQGRIGMIVSSRASERRHIIEEAAGITKFKAKKRAAERKLEQTKHNLLRVTDIVEELGNRLGTLRRQAQKAERYRRYRAEVKDIELHVAAHKLLGFIADEKRSRIEQGTLADELMTVRMEFDALEAGVVAERAELALEERRLADVQEEIYELDNNIKLSESKIAYQRKEAAELEERAASAHGEIRALSERSSGATEEIERQHAGLGRLASELGELSSTVSVVDAAFASARVELSRTEADLERSRERLAAARTEKTQAEARRESLERRVEDSQRRLEQVLAETTEHNHRSAILSREVMKLERTLGELKQQRLDLTMRTEQMARRHGELEVETAEGETEVEALRDELHRRRSRLQSLREINERYEGFARGTRAVMQRRAELFNAPLGAGSEDSEQAAEIRGLVADMVEVPEQLEVAVEAALGERLGGILVSTEQASERAIDYLKQSSSGRSSFVPLARPSSPFEVVDRSGMAVAEPGVIGHVVDLVTIDPRYREVANDLLGGAVVVETLHDAFRLRRTGTRGTMVTLDGDVLDDRGVVAGGSREATGTGVLAQKREIRELAEICQSLESDLASATARFVSRKTELRGIGRTLESLRTETHDGELAITAHEKDLSGARSEQGQVRTRLTRLNAEQLELEERIGEATRECSTLVALEADASERIERRAGEVEDLTARLPVVRERVESMSHAVTDAKVKVAQLGEKRASAEASALRLENARRELEDRIGRLESSINADIERAATLRSESDELDAETAIRSTRRRGKAETLGEGRISYDSRTAEVAEAELATRKQRHRAEALSAEVTAIEMKLTNLEVNRQHLEEGVEERYRVRLARIIGDYHLRPQVSSEDEDRLEQRKRLIERMGTDINLTAIDEFAEISERHEFLSTQRGDLHNAVGQLERAIVKINRISRKLFRETFEAVNANFAKMFPRLFHGGRAKLTLTGGENVDLLDAGVEIMAQPPGKKNTTVDQLSGGEKALTAVALIFSIFLIKPSPFCLLDEVDAPLDDVNVDRYNAMLREMTDRSQFICITHNKRTMEIADRLYGVTMQELGVSKIVTVNLSKIGANGDLAA